MKRANVCSGWRESWEHTPTEIRVPPLCSPHVIFFWPVDKYLSLFLFTYFLLAAIKIILMIAFIFIIYVYIIVRVNKPSFSGFYLFVEFKPGFVRKETQRSCLLLITIRSMTRGWKVCKHPLFLKKITN